MKRICTTILLLVFLVGCGKQIQETSFADGNSNRELPMTTHATQTGYPETLPLEYEEILSQYKVIVNSWSSDNNEEGHPNFTNDFENHKLPYPNGSEEYEWDEMLIDGKYPKFSKYGYVLKDINGDNTPEMFWVYEDYTLLAAFTIVDGKAVTIGAYRPRARAIVLDSGVIYEYRSGGADIYECSLLMLSPNADQLSVIKKIGCYDDENFYEIKDGQKTAISKADFDAFVQQYPFPLEPTESWKKNIFYLVETQGDGSLS